MVEKRVLLFENTDGMSRELVEALRGLDAGIKLQIVHSNLEMLDYVSRYSFLLIILAFYPSAGNYTSYIKAIRNQSVAPILILTSSAIPEDEINFLDAGADRFLCVGFPFNIHLSIVNVRAILGFAMRILSRNGQGESIYGTDLKINSKLQRVYIHGNNLGLTRKQFDILKCLSEHVGEIVTKEELYQDVWASNFDVNADEALKYHIKEIRKKLRAYGLGDLIETIWGVGYLISFREIL